MPLRTPLPFASENDRYLSDDPNAIVLKAPLCPPPCILLIDARPYYSDAGDAVEIRQKKKEIVT